MSRLKQLDAVSRLLAGRLPRAVEWMPVLKLANEALVTPQIYAAALHSGIVPQMPADVRAFLHEVWLRNRARNRRLFGQLRLAITALNAAGLEPMLLKGAAGWVLQGRPRHYDQMMSDLDLLIAHEETGVAIQALEAAGFAVLTRDPDPDHHVAAELGRPQDVGVIDLHRRAPGPPELARAAMALEGQTLQFEWDGLRARTPSPTLQILLLVLHDQFQDGGYWRGEFAPRHLLEIAALSREPGAVDWSVLAGLVRTRLERNAIDAELRAAATMCGAHAPGTAERPWVRLQHARRRAQFAWPGLDALLRQFAA